MNLRSLDSAYCKALGIFNPYDALEYRITNDLPRFDAQAYRLNKEYRFVYDKLFIAQSQGMRCGTLESLRTDTPDFPIFIKPRYGHKTASSKYCYKIASRAELEPHFSKPDMMWSEFVNATEGMTDFVLVDGEIVYQLSYKYSEKQLGFADVWKLISSDLQPPSEIVDWVGKHMQGYTGPLNVQYRDVKIIEVGMRFARSGMYIESAQNHDLVDAINRMWETKSWDHRADNKLRITPFYSFKCWSPCPVFYLLPQHAVDWIMHKHKCMTFYEYYFEPTGKSSLVFFQFLHRDFEKGMQAKRELERWLIVMNAVMAILLLFGVLMVVWKKTFTWLVVALLLYLTTLINSVDVIVHQIKNQRQFTGL